MASTATVSCPEGFVIPDNPNHPRNHWIADTGCAVACRRPVWTQEEYQAFDSVVSIVPAIGVFFSGVIMFIWVSDEKKRAFKRTGYRLTFLITTIVINSIVHVMPTFAGLKPETHLCLNNAVPRRQADGSSLCTAKAALHMYTGMVASFCWLAICINLYRTSVLHLRRNGSKSTCGDFLEFYMVFALPLILVIVAVKNKMFGYGGDQPWCYFHSDVSPITSLYVSYLPAIVVILMGSYCFFAFVGQSLSAYVVKALRLARVGVLPGGPPIISSNSLGDRGGAPMVGGATLETADTRRPNADGNDNNNEEVGQLVMSFRPDGSIQFTRRNNVPDVADTGPQQEIVASGGRNQEANTNTATAAAGGLNPLTAILPVPSATLFAQRPSSSSAAISSRTQRRHPAPFFAAGTVAGLLALRHKYSGGVKTLVRDIKVSRLAVIFMSFFYLAWAVLLYYRALIIFHQKEADRSYQQWVQCVFDNYDTTAPSSSDGGGNQNAWWRAVCGRHAHYRIPFIPSVLAFAMTTGTGLMLFCACSVSLSGLVMERIDKMFMRVESRIRKWKKRVVTTS